MLARDVIVALLSAHVPSGVDVIAYARNIDPPSRSTVMVRIDKVTPSRAASALWEVTAALVLVSAKVTPGAGDDELDALLQDVLYALDQQDVANALSWTEANRAVYGEPDPTNPAYEVVVTAFINKEN